MSRVLLSITHITGRVLIASPFSSCSFFAFNNQSGNCGYRRSKSEIDLHEKSSTHRITRICRKPTKLSINTFSYIITKRRYCVAAVIGQALVQSITFSSNFTSQTTKSNIFSSIFGLVPSISANYEAYLRINPLPIYIKGVLCPRRSFIGIQCHSGPRFGIRKFVE